MHAYLTLSLAEAEAIVASQERQYWVEARLACRELKSRDPVWIEGCDIGLGEYVIMTFLKPGGNSSVQLKASLGQILVVMRQDGTPKLIHGRPLYHEDPLIMAAKRVLLIDSVRQPKPAKSRKHHGTPLWR